MAEEVTCRLPPTPKFSSEGPEEGPTNLASLLHVCLSSLPGPHCLAHEPSGLHPKCTLLASCAWGYVGMSISLTGYHGLRIPSSS